MTVRVLVVGPAPAGARSRGGMATVSALMADHPDPAVEVTVVATYLDAPRWHQLLVGLTGMVRAAWHILAGRADVVHVHLSHGGSVLRKAVPLAAARLTATPALVHGHSFDFGGWFDRLSPVGQALVRRALRADRWIVLGAHQAAEYAPRLRVAPENITVLPNAVGLGQPSCRQDETGPVHAVSLGRLGTRKGTFDLVQAVAALAPEIRERLRVTLAGDGDGAAVAAAVEAMQLGDTIEVVGWLEPAARDRLLCRAQVFVLPSYDEGLPMALLEAMARGLVPVTTAVGSIAEVVADGRTGLLVRAGDVDGLAATLTTVIDDGALRVRMGAAARERTRSFGLDGWYRRLSELWHRPRVDAA